MRLLHVALIVANSPQWALRNALRGIADEYQEYDWCAANDRGEDTSAGILAAARQFNPDVTFMQLQGPTVLQVGDAMNLPGFVVNWSGDVRQPTPQWYSDLGRVINLTLFSNEADPKVLKAQGINAGYMDIGFDDTIWHPGNGIGKWTADADWNWPEIVFLGGNYGDCFPLSQYRRDMVALLAARYGDRFGCYGPGWSGPSTYPLIDIYQEAECLRSTKIVINLSHFNLERYSSDRLLRSLGCGAFVLSHNYPGIEKDFRAGEDLEVWDDFDDLVDKIDEFLLPEMKDTRCRIAATGWATAHSRHTWDYRVKRELLPLIQNQCSFI